MNKNLKTIIYYICMTAFFAGCSSSISQRSGHGSDTVKLNASDVVYIAIPKDGVYGSISYPGSGRTTAQVIHRAFASKTLNVRQGVNQEDYDSALNTAKRSGAKYLVFSTILHWEDRATEWSMRRDHVEVKIDLIEVASGNLVTGTLIKGRSKLLSFGGDHPQELLPKGVNIFVSDLY